MSLNNPAYRDSQQGAMSEFGFQVAFSLWTKPVSLMRLSRLVQGLPWTMGGPWHR